MVGYRIGRILLFVRVILGEGCLHVPEKRDVDQIDWLRCFGAPPARRFATRHCLPVCRCKQSLDLQSSYRLSSGKFLGGPGRILLIQYLSPPRTMQNAIRMFDKSQRKEIRFPATVTIFRLYRNFTTKHTRFAVHCVEHILNCNTISPKGRVKYG